MKKIYKLVVLFVLILSGRSFSQAPVMFPVSGPTAVCSAPAPTSNYSSSATNSPTLYVWSVVPSAGVVIGSPNASSTSISFPASNATYTVSCYAMNSFGAGAPVNYVVIVFQTPLVTFSGANSFCQGSSTNLSASSTLLSGSSTISYNWSPSTGLNTTTGPNVIASPVTTTTYIVTGTIGFCSNTSAIVVNVLPVPFISTVSSPSVVCSGNQASNTASGANTYTWSNGVFNGALFTPLSTASYTVIGRAVNGCTNSAISSITVNPVPSVQAHSTSSVICNGSPTTLYGSGATTYSWSGGVTDNTAFTPSVTGSYTVSGSTPGCTGTYTAATSVVVNPSPLITVNTSSAVICITQSATLTITGTAVSYSLNGVSSATSVAVSPSVNTTYTISGVTSLGCQASKTFTQGVSSCAGVHDLTAPEISSLKAYPNPASNYFSLRSGKNETVVIVNEFGQVVRTLELRADTEATVSDLASGMYFIISPGVRIKIAVLNN